MYKFGVCNYDFDLPKPKVEDLQIFDTYEDAYDNYIEHCIAGANGHPDKTEWIVWIDGDELIQFDRFETVTKSTKIRIK